MNILVTGATGFIGRNLISFLYQEKHNIFCTLLKNEVNPFGENKVKGFVVENYNIEKTKTFLSINRIEGIIHLASFVLSGEHNPKEIKTLLDTNIIFGTTLLEAASLAKVKWFINTGTYWQFYKSEKYCPVNLYAASKQAFMDLAKYYWDTGKIKFCSIILYDTYGPNDPRKKFFSLWEQNAEAKEFLDMSPGEQIIDISHVKDIASAFTLLANHLSNNTVKIKNGDTFAVKALDRYKLKDLALIYEKATGKKLNINWGGRPYREREVFIPNDKLKVVPGWRPTISIIEALREMRTY